VGLTAIGDEAFSECLSLRFITLPEGFAAVGNRAFNECVNLISIALPNSLRTIGISAFNDCRSLSSITLPPGLTGIGHLAFAGCVGLGSITLPAGLTAVGNWVFSFCKSLSSITVLAREPPRLDRLLWYLQDVPPALIYVSAATLEAYRNAEGWKNHADRIRAVEQREERPVPADKADVDLKEQLETLRELYALIDLLEERVNGSPEDLESADTLDLVLQAYELMEQLDGLSKEIEEGKISEDVLKYIREQLEIEE
jgi:hypothetical protein